jgi:hypothetical protein
VATETPLSPLGLARQVEATGHGRDASRDAVDGVEPAAEAVMMGLRLAEGVATDRICRGWGWS